MNRLKVNERTSIDALHGRGWSKRRIARELGLDRATVRRHLAANAATPHTGSPDGDGADAASVNTGSAEDAEPKAATHPHTGSDAAESGPASLCDPWVEAIGQGFRAGLSVQRIFQDLVAGHGFTGSYHSVRRFIRRRFGPEVEPPFRRMECAAGQEMQVDFGQGAWVVEDGKRRRPHLFRCVLSHSRKGYCEAVWRQTAESFIRCLENAFRHFGGVTATVVIDNLKAGVILADWFDPELNPKLEEFARHYGTAILPTKPVMPRHKGKIEAGVKYAQNNAVKGRSFTSLAEQNLFLAEWERTVADTRIHGTIRQQVGKFFLEAEKPALRALPAMVFPVFEEARRTVHRDGHVEFKRAYYSVPPEYAGSLVWVRQETRLLRVHNRRRSEEHLLDQCRLLGPLTGTWAEAMHQARGPQGLRVMLGLLQLAGKHPVAELEKAAGTATHHGAWRLRDLKRLLDQPANVVQLDFLEVHPLIRPLTAYRIASVEEIQPTQTP